jgi:hypothetical protein
MEGSMTLGLESQGMQLAPSWLCYVVIFLVLAAVASVAMGDDDDDGDGA